jgi:hypothetical protein
LGGAHTTSALQVVVSYSDQSSTTYLGATQLSNSNGITAVTICSAPAASTIRDIDMATVLNTDSVSQTITIQLLDTSTAYKIISTTLLVGEKLTYTHGSGWQVVDNSGNLKTVVLSTSGVNSFSGGSTGLTPTSATTGVVTLGGTLAVANGGTGLTSTPANGALDIGNGSGFTRATLTAGTGISVTNAAGSITIAATNSGTVTSVTGTSPVVSSGGATPAISLAASYGDTQNPYASKTANYVLAGPNGSAGVPTFRAIVAADIPTLNQNTTGTAANITASSNATLTTLSSLSLPGSQVSGNISGNAANVTGTVAVANGGTGLTTTPVNGALDIGNGTGFTRTTLTAGTNVSITNTSGAITINSSNPGGTVTSVGLALPSIMSVSGSPVTSSGTLTGTLTTQSVNAIFAGPSSGSAAAPTFRALTTADIPSLSYVSSVGATAPITSTGGLTPTIGVTAAALNKVDDTNVTMTLSGSPSTALIAATTMGLGWTGQLAVSRGGTGVALTTANFVFAGPTSGSPAAPSFRALTTTDIPSLAYVTSVSLSLPSILTVSGSPVTSSGTLTGTLTTQAVNTIFAGPSSGAGVAPTFRSLTTADIPTLNQNTTGTAANITATSNSTLTTLSALSLPGSQVSGNISGNAANVTGTVAIGNGGTGQTTASAAFNALSPITTTGDLIIGNGTNSATRLGIGTNGYVLTSNGTTATWSAATGGVSQIVAGTNVTISPSGGTGVVTINASGGGSSSAYTRTTFTATAGQTAFTVTYAVGYLQIYVNGVLLTGSDYTATSGTGFTLNVACLVGDIVEALVITTSVTGVTTGKSIAMAMIFGY